MKLKSRIFAVVCLVMLGYSAWPLPAHADIHIYAGAAGTNQNDKLYFSNGSAFDAGKSTFAFPQILRTNGLNTGYYRGEVGQITFASLAGTIDNGGPIPGSAALGAQLAVQVVSVSGPTLTALESTAAISARSPSVFPLAQQPGQIHLLSAKTTAFPAPIHTAISTGVSSLPANPEPTS